MVATCDWGNFLVVVADFVVNDVAVLPADVFVILVAFVFVGIVATLLYRVPFTFYSIHSDELGCRIPSQLEHRKRGVIMIRGKSFLLLLLMLLPCTNLQPNLDVK